MHGVAVAWLVRQCLAAHGGGAFEIHRRRCLQVELGQQQAALERGRVFVEDLIDDEFCFAGKAGKGQQPRLEYAGFGAVARWRRQLVECAGGALPAALADVDFAEPDLRAGAIGRQIEDALQQWCGFVVVALVHKRQGFAVESVALGRGGGLAAPEQPGQEQAAAPAHQGCSARAASLARARW